MSVLCEKSLTKCIRKNLRTTVQNLRSTSINFATRNLCRWWISRTLSWTWDDYSTGYQCEYFKFCVQSLCFQNLVKYPLYACNNQTLYREQIERGALKSRSEISNLNDPFRKNCAFTTSPDLALREPTGGYWKFYPARSINRFLFYRNNVDEFMATNRLNYLL